MPDVQYNEPILQLLDAHGLITAEQSQEILDEHQRSGKSVREIVVNMELLQEDSLLELIAESLGTRVVNLPATDIAPDVVHAIPASVARM